MRLKSQQIGGLIAMRERRNFSDDFKKQVVESIVPGSATQAELARQYRISPVMINRWKKDYKAGKFFENVSSHDVARHELKDKGA
jgi:transposase